MTPAWLARFARAMAEQEGFGVAGARPTRNHNPLDLRGWPGYPADEGGFTVFPDDETGWAKAEEDLANHVSRYPLQTLLGFIAGGAYPHPTSDGGTVEAYWPGYAPASDGNDPALYAARVAAALGVTPQARLLDLEALDAATPAA